VAEGSVTHGSDHVPLGYISTGQALSEIRAWEDLAGPESFRLGSFRLVDCLSTRSPMLASTGSRAGLSLKGQRLAGLSLGP